MFATHESSIIKESFNHLFNQDAIQVPISSKTLPKLLKDTEVQLQTQAWRNLWTKSTGTKQLFHKACELGKACANVGSYIDEKLLNIQYNKVQFLAGLHFISSTCLFKLLVLQGRYCYFFVYTRRLGFGNTNQACQLYFTRWLNQIAWTWLHWLLFRY